MEKSWLKDLDIKILILSRGRSESISTHRLLPEYIEILVPESEKALYEAKVSNPILTTPDDIIGMGRLRNWVLDNFTERIVIMLDDDIARVYSLTGRKSRAIVDPIEIIQILINNAIMANDMGVGLFGFFQTDIRKYKGTDPFSLIAWVGGVIGIIGREFRFRDDKYKVDVDYSLQNLMVHRRLFCNNMYTFSQKRDNNVGGNSIFRNQAEYEESVKTLKEKWGRFINVTKRQTQITIKTNVKRKQAIIYE